MSSSAQIASAPLLLVDIQIELGEDSEDPPSTEQLTTWALAAYEVQNSQPAELTIRLVQAAEMAELNSQYRGKDGPTNVLSFAIAENEQELEFLTPEFEQPLLGDIVICHSVVVDEAWQQGKSLHEHYAHMVTHGVLHLCGFDHQTDAEAKVMEALEQQVLATQGIDNPYAAVTHTETKQ